MENIGFIRRMPVAELVKLARTILGPDAALEEIGILDPGGEIFGVADGRLGGAGILCFVDRPLAADAIRRLENALVITNPEISPLLNRCRRLVVDDPRALFIDLLNRIMATVGFACFTSLIEADAGIDPGAEIHPRAVIEAGVRIGGGTTIGAGCVIKRGTAIGCGVIIRENTVIGCDGIALYRARDGRVLRFPHLAGVIVDDGVEIGASCVLARGVMSSTRVGGETVIGNLSNVGHAVRIGSRVWMSVGCLLGGNSTIGEGVTLGMGAAVRDNIRIGEYCSIGMGSVVVKDLPDHTPVFGNPARRLPEVKAGPSR